MTTTIKPARLCLSDREPFGVGGRRLCFTHPHDPGKCVKVLRQDRDRTIRGKRSGRIPARFRRRYDNNAHEQRVLEALFDRLGTEMCRHLPRCYGMTETDRGPGLVLDLIRDRDGKISRSLRELISTGFDLSEFRPAFDEFSEFLLEHAILTRSLLDHNIAVQERVAGTWRMYLIDGLGDPAWLPLARWFRPLGLNKIRRRIRSAWDRFDQLFRQGGISQELIASSTWGQGFLNHRE